MIVLGIDPGVANTGYGIVAHDRGRLVALDGGVIETPAGQDAGARLAVIHARVGMRPRASGFTPMPVLTPKPKSSPIDARRSMLIREPSS